MSGDIAFGDTIFRTGLRFGRLSSRACQGQCDGSLARGDKPDTGWKISGAGIETTRILEALGVDPGGLPQRSERERRSLATRFRPTTKRTPG